tara:strand:+ start:2338 stop:3294 length:957 start_codon:yes stop_codon:yes gene_type:complete
MQLACLPADPPLSVEEDTEPTVSDTRGLVGTYQLVGRELKDDEGVWQLVEDFDSVGYITYSDAGYMGVQVMPNGRTPFAGDRPTPEEAQQALRGYSAYFGPYTVSASEGFVVHHRVGQINPGGEVDAKRFYEFDGDRLILTPADSTGGKAEATRRILWQRLPNVELSAEAQRFVGFRQLLHTDRYVERDGEVVSHGEENASRAGSYIIYTPTGHMMVHLVPQEARTPYADSTPTPEEALAAYRAFGGYFGQFTVFEDADPQYVVHNQEGRLNPGPPVDAERLYLLTGDILRLGGRPRTNQGETTGGHLYWERLPVRGE